MYIYHQMVVKDAGRRGLQSRLKICLAIYFKKKKWKKKESFFSSSRIPCSHSVMEGIKWPKSSQSGLWQKQPALRSSCADASRRVRHHFVTELMPQKKSSVQIYDKNCFKKLLFMKTRSHLRSNFEKIRENKQLISIVPRVCSVADQRWR